MGSMRESLIGRTTMKAVVEKELGEEVIAVGALRQGKPPSMVSMLTGAALIGLVRPRASKALPKRFLLAVTADRIVALGGAPVSDEDGNDTGAIVRGECGSWARGEVSVTDIPADDSPGATLQIPGASIPVFDPNIGDPDERKLFAALG
jgi:hypothetical protein